MIWVENSAPKIATMNKWSTVTTLNSTLKAHITINIDSTMARLLSIDSKVELILSESAKLTNPFNKITTAMKTQVVG